MTSEKPIIVLYNRGGGMRGLIPAHIMAKIEDTTGLRMAEMVDVFTGPSTGAILNAALNVPHAHDPNLPKFRARHMVKFYEREGIRIFPPDRFRDFRALLHDFNNRTMKINRLASLLRHGHYNPDYLAHALKNLLGDTKLSQSIKSLVIPVYNLDGTALEKVSGQDDAPISSAIGDTEGGYAVWLKNIKFGANLSSVPDVTLSDAILASCAAPSYFPCHHFNVTYPDRKSTREYSGIDGNIFDNPPVNYFSVLKPSLPPGRKISMIVLGTGNTLRSFKKEDWNRYGGLGIVDPVNDLPLINIFFHASETALNDSFKDDIGRENLFIFNKSLLAEIGKPGAPSLRIDDANPENLKSLYNFSEEILEANRQKFEDACHMLVNSRDARLERHAEQKKESRRWYCFLTDKIKS